MKLLKLTARVLVMHQKMPETKFKNVTIVSIDTWRDYKRRTILDCTSTENYARRLQKKKIQTSLHRKCNDGIYTVVGRSQWWLEIRYNKQELVLLPYKHRFSKLYAEHIYQREHLEVLLTASAIRSRFWIIRLL